MGAGDSRGFDSNQPFWQLAGIQIAATSLPLAVLGGQFASLYGAGTALASIFVGNLVLWIIGLAIIAMSSVGRVHSIENVRAYLGEWGAIGGALVLLVAFILWIAVVLEAGSAVFSKVIDDLLPNTPDVGKRIGVALGVLSALAATGGIRWIKWTCIGVLPLLGAFFIWALIKMGQSIPFAGTWDVSLPATMTAVAVTLPGMVNIPTFFRHARSKPHSFLALSVLTVFTALIESSGIWVADFYSDANGVTGFYIVGFLIIIAMSTICTGAVNIYFASAGWESITPRAWRAKEYAIVGLVGTVTFVFIQSPEWTIFLENILTGFLGCMGVILIAGFLIRLVVRHRPRPYEKIVGGLCWLIGCIIVILVQRQDSLLSGRALMSGTATSAMAVLVFILIEETYWSFSQIYRNTRLGKR